MLVLDLLIFILSYSSISHSYYIYLIYILTAFRQQKALSTALGGKEG